MNNNAVVRARVSEQDKVIAMQNAKALGLDLSTIIRLVVNKLAVDGSLPSDLLAPNKKTLQAIADMEKGKDITTYQTVEELKTDLGWD